MSIQAITGDPLDRLLRGVWTDPDTGAPIGVPIRAIAIERSVTGQEADLVAPLQLGRRLAVVSDATTHEVLGEQVERALARLAAITPVVLDGEPHADAETAGLIGRACAEADALIAVGSGTVNDLCKHAAAQDGKPYAVFATAPSMNGYTSKNAAITVAGHKKSLASIVPVGVFVDLTVFAAAPPRMIRAGLGDSLCRSTAQADWLLSHHLLGTSYRAAPFALLAADEPALLDEPEALFRGDPESMRPLARTLILSGLGMTLCDGSYPASQGEHLISHYIDMFAPPDRGAYFHGEQVGVATLTMARIQEKVLEGAPPHLRAEPINREELERRFGPELGASCWQEFAAKHWSPAAEARLDRHLNDSWSEIRASVASALLPADRIHIALQRAGCPTRAADIGLASSFYAEAVRNARYLRDRYTFLDLADDSGQRALMSAS